MTTTTRTDFNPLATCAFVVLDPADQAALAEALEDSGSGLVATRQQLEDDPALVDGLDVTVLIRQDAPDDGTAARSLGKRLGGDPQEYRAVVVPGWTRDVPLGGWLYARPNGIKPPRCLGVWLQSLRDADLGPDPASNGHHQANGNGKAHEGNGKAIDYAGLSDADLGIVHMEDEEPENVEWLWPDRYVKGELNLTAGEGGLGKSFLALHRAALVSTGGEWPDGSGPAERGVAVIVSAEDDPRRALAPRLYALGADLSRIKFLKATVTLRPEGRPALVHPVYFDDVRYWQATLDRFDDVKLFFVDGLPAYLGRGVNDSKNNEVRSVLEPFIKEVIRPRHIVMDAVTHLNKTIGADTPHHRILGSVAYYNLARTVHVVFCDAEDRERKLFGIIKNNYGPINLPSMAFRIEGRTVQARGKELRTAAPVFEPQTVMLDLRDALRGEGGKRGPKPVKALAVAAWLVEQLRDRPQPTPLAELIDDAGEAGFLGKLKPDGKWSCVSALYRARKAVPSLEGDLDGWHVEEIPVENPDRPGKPRTFWELRPADDGDQAGDGPPF